MRSCQGGYFKYSIWLPWLQEEAGDSVIRLIRSLPEGTRVVIGLYYVGKEELLVKMGVALRRPIGVDSAEDGAAETVGGEECVHH